MLEEHVRNADVMLIVLTQGYISSYNCRRELVEALRMKKRILVLCETDPNHGAVSTEALVEEVAMLAMREDREAGEVLTQIVASAEALEQGEALEWHRESHLKRAVLARIVQCVVSIQTGGAGPNPTLKVACTSEPDRASHKIDIRLHLFDQYRLAMPSLYTLLQREISAAGGVLECTPHPPEPGVPTVLLLCPELFSNAELVNLLVTTMQLDSPEALDGAVRLYATSTPFELYRAHCPEELKNLGILSQMYAPRASIAQTHATPQ